MDDPTKPNAQNHEYGPRWLKCERCGIQTPRVSKESRLCSDPTECIHWRPVEYGKCADIEYVAPKTRRSRRP